MPQEFEEIFSPFHFVFSGRSFEFIVERGAPGCVPPQGGERAQTVAMPWFSGRAEMQNGVAFPAYVLGTAFPGRGQQDGAVRPVVEAEVPLFREKGNAPLAYDVEYRLVMERVVLFGGASHEFFLDSVPPHGCEVHEEDSAVDIGGEPPAFRSCLNARNGVVRHVSARCYVIVSQRYVEERGNVAEAESIAIHVEDAFVIGQEFRQEETIVCGAGDVTADVKGGQVDL